MNFFEKIYCQKNDMKNLGHKPIFVFHYSFRPSAIVNLWKNIWHWWKIISIWKWWIMDGKICIFPVRKRRWFWKWASLLKRRTECSIPIGKFRVARWNSRWKASKKFPALDSSDQNLGSKFTFHFQSFIYKFWLNIKTSNMRKI